MTKIENLLDRYDFLGWELARTYGASARHGLGGMGNIATLHRRRHQLNAKRLEVRGQIIAIGTNQTAN